MRTMTGIAAAALMIAGTCAPAVAQRYDRDALSYNKVIRAIIMDDIAGQRQAERDAKRFPYASAGYGPIKNARQARDACAADVLRELGRGARLPRVPVASTMSTGWEVEGPVTSPDGATSFVCSVRNGSVSGTLIR